MTQSLKEEFEAKGRWPLRRLAVIPAIGAARWLIGALWPVSTLRHAKIDIGSATLARPYQARAFQGSPFVSWNWVDASRRDEMLRAAPKSDDVVAAMLRHAEGRRFLFHPLSMQALLATPKGDVFVFKTDWEKYTRIARDAAGGPVLDLAPYTVTAQVVVVPVETMKDFVRLHADGVWRFFVVADGEASGESRNAIAIHDAVAALAHLREASR